MKILLTTLEGNLFPIEVSPDLEVINLKALCEQETRIPMGEMSLSFSGQVLDDDSKPLTHFSVNENDIIMVQKIRTNTTSVPPASTSTVTPNLPFIDFSSISVPQSAPQSRPTSSGGSSSRQQQRLASMLQMLMSDPSQLQQVRQRFPELASAIERNDTARAMQLIGQLSGQGQRSENVNEFDIETQRRLAETIRMENIQQNMEHALECMPEAFGNVVMLYINCKVNGHDVKAFVDSGAQMTIMSSACAERCGIMRLVDSRWSGIAKGVGTQKIVGRVHIAQIQIEKTFLTTSFSILENQPMDMLLGLDILKRHQCIIDLERNMLIFKNDNVETRFLSEAELPANARLNHEHEPEPSMSPPPPASNVPTTSSASNQPTALSSSASTANSPYPEATISNLMKMGFSREVVIETLNTCNGDQNSAQIILLAKSIQVPVKRK